MSMVGIFIFKAVDASFSMRFNPGLIPLILNLQLVLWRPVSFPCRFYSLLLSLKWHYNNIHTWCRCIYFLCFIYSSVVIDSPGFPCQTSPSSNTTNAAFPLINRCNSIRSSIFISPPILESMGVGKSARTLSTMFVVPTISSCAFGGINGRVFLCNSSFHMLKRQ